MSNGFLDGTVTDQNGVAVPGAQVYVYDGRGQDGGLSLLYDSLGQSITNPVTTDDGGYWSAYAANNQFYTEAIYWGGRKRYVESNVLLGTAAISTDPNLRVDLATSGDGKGASLVNTSTGIDADTRLGTLTTNVATNTAGINNLTTEVGDLSDVVTAGGAGGLFASTAAALGNGLAGYSSLVAGSGGTNGTFPLVVTGGTQVVPAIGFFTVAGGAVTAITVTKPGYYSSNPTGFNFSGSSGLTGASATPATAANTADGSYFQVPSSHSGYVDLYKNNGGSALYVDTAPNVSAYTNFLNEVLPTLETGEETVGRKDADPATGTTISTSTYVFIHPLQGESYLKQLKVFSVASGTLTIRFFTLSGTSLTQYGSDVTLTLAGTGLETFTDAQFGYVSVPKNTYVAIYAPSKLAQIGAGTSSYDPIYVLSGNATSGTTGTVSTSSIQAAFVWGNLPDMSGIAEDVQDKNADYWNAATYTVDIGFFYHMTTGVKTANAAYAGLKVAVAEGARVRATGTVGAAGDANVALAVYYAADGATVLGHEVHSTSGATAYVEHELTLPQGTAFVAVSSELATDPALLSFPALEVASAPPAGYAADFDAKLTALDALFAWEALTADSSEAGTYYNRATGATGSNASFTAYHYTLTGDEVSVRATAQISGTSTALALYYDGANAYIGYETVGTSSPINYSHQVLNVPKNARKLVVDGYLTPPVVETYQAIGAADTGPPITMALVCGDSITNTRDMSLADQTPGNNGNATAVSWVTYTLPSVAVDWRNYARAGATWTKQASLEATDPFVEGNHQVDTAIASGVTFDCIIFALGTNDVSALNSGNCTLGDYTTAMATAVGSLDTTIIYQAIRRALHLTAAQWPEAFRFLMLPIQRAGNPWTPSYVQTNMLTPLRTMAAEYGFTVIDQQDESGIARVFEVAGGAGEDLSDGTHPYENVGNTKGVGKMARLARNVILSRVNA